VTAVEKTVRFLDRVVDLVFHLAVAASILIVLHVCLAIFSRYLFHYPLNWVSGVVSLLTDWAVFLMVGVYIYRNQGITIPFFYERLFPAGMKRVVDFAVTMIVLTFTAVMGWFCWRSIIMIDYNSSLSIIPIKFYWFTAPFLIAMLLGTIGGLKRLLLGPRHPDSGQA